MRRRGFLGALLGLAAAPVLARLPLMTATEGIEVVETPIILPTLRGLGEVLEVSLMGLGTDEGAEHVRLMRGATTVFSMSTPRMGGVALWLPGFMPTIPFTEQAPIVLDISPLASARVIFRRDGKLHALHADHSKVQSDVPLFLEQANAS